MGTISSWRDGTPRARPFGSPRVRGQPNPGRVPGIRSPRCAPRWSGAPPQIHRVSACLAATSLQSIGVRQRPRRRGGRGTSGPRPLRRSASAPVPGPTQRGVLHHRSHRSVLADSQISTPRARFGSSESVSILSGTYSRRGTPSRSSARTLGRASSTNGRITKKTSIRRIAKMTRNSPTLDEAFGVDDNHRP